MYHIRFKLNIVNFSKALPADSAIEPIEFHLTSFKRSSEPELHFISLSFFFFFLGFFSFLTNSLVLVVYFWRKDNLRLAISLLRELCRWGWQKNAALRILSLAIGSTFVILTWGLRAVFQNRNSFIFEYLPRIEQSRISYFQTLNVLI